MLHIDYLDKISHFGIYVDLMDHIDAIITMYMCHDAYLKKKKKKKKKTYKLNR